MMQRIEGRVQHYAWGSPTAIPGLLGLPATGEPYAEHWLGAHESAPSLVGGAPLDALIAPCRSRLTPTAKRRRRGSLGRTRPGCRSTHRNAPTATRGPSRRP